MIIQQLHDHRVVLINQVNASDVIILEGILVFHDPRLRNLMNLKIFVDTDADVRLARRIRRDTVERGRDINAVLEQVDQREVNQGLLQVTTEVWKGLVENYKNNSVKKKGL